jgi:ferritin
MLSESQLERLNAQIAAENFASQLYLSASCWCHSKGFQGCGNFFAGHSEQEATHMRKLLDYVIKTGGHAHIGAVAAPPAEFGSLKQVFETVFDHEKGITAKINSLVDFFLGAKDYSTFNFLQWYVAEQHEEEHLFRSILEKIELIGDVPSRLYWIDKEVGKLAKGATAPGLA